MRQGIHKLILWGGPALVLIALGGLVLLWLGNDTGSKDFGYQAFLRHEEVSGDSASVARELVERWLRHFKSSATGWTARLRAYRIDRVEVTRIEGRMIVSATFQVQPTRWSFDNWLAGSGGTVEGGWIRGKFTRFVLTETKEGYWLKQVGPGPV